jgi:hypothetical protein
LWGKRSQTLYYYREKVMIMKTRNHTGRLDISPMGHQGKLVRSLVL